MARLPMLKSSLPMLGPRFKPMMQTRNPEAVKRVRGRAWMETRDRWFRAHPLCVECEKVGIVRAANRLDHRVPLIDGGVDDESNYQGLCDPCHDIKTAAEAKARGRS